MNKTELAAALAAKTGMTKALAGDVIGALFDTDGIIAGSLKKGDSVTIPGFGSFSVSHSKARQGRNPQTGATITIPARNRPVFKAGKGIKEVVN